MRQINVKNIYMIESTFIGRYNPDYEPKDLLKIIKYINKIKKLLDDNYHYGLSWYERWKMKQTVCKLNFVLQKYDYTVVY